MTTGGLEEGRPGALGGDHPRRRLCTEEEGEGPERVMCGEDAHHPVPLANQHAADLFLPHQSHGFPDSVVWNPGRAGSEALPDLQSDAYQHFLCVEAALVVQPVEIAGGATWTGSQNLRKLPN